MINLEVISVNAELHVKLNLVPMIADWSTTHTKFISGLAKHFDGRYLIRPENFRVDTSASFARNCCTCEILGGACRISLSPGEMGLTVVNATRNDYPTVGEILKRTWNWLHSDISEHTHGWSTFESKEHLQSTDADAIDPYLGQFVLAGAAMVANSTDGAVLSFPSARATLSDKNGAWALRRSVERSEMVANGVFVDTYIEIRSPAVALPDPFAFLAEVDTLADRAVGLHFRDERE